MKESTATLVVEVKKKGKKQRMENVWVAQPKTSSGRPDELFWKGERENEGMGLRQGSDEEGESATRPTLMPTLAFHFGGGTMGGTMGGAHFWQVPRVSAVLPLDHD